MPKSTQATLAAQLERFQKDFRLFNVGGLGTALVITRRAKKYGLPLSLKVLITPGGGQVSGLSGRAISKILKEHGENRRVGTESGRTSRGTINPAKAYANLLNQLAGDDPARLDDIEKWWVAKFTDYFDTEPFTLKYDRSKKLGAVIQNLFDQAVERQQRYPGKTYVGALLQHLVGAKLELALPEIKIAHHGHSVADKSDRFGDFDLDDIVIHCTTAPSQELLLKCQKNIESGKRPIILTRFKMISAAEDIAESLGISDRVEVMDARHFIATNLYELGLLKASKRHVTVDKLISKYNEIVEEHEADRSLAIQLG